MLNLFIFFLLLVVPGFIALWLFEIAADCKVKNCCKWVICALVFDLAILIINLAGLYICKGICTLDRLICYFGYLSFIYKYALTSIFTGIVLAIVFAFLFKLCFKKNCSGHKDEK
jgi:hypothetical protein